MSASSGSRLSPGPAVVAVPVTTLWIAPDRPRTVDAPILATPPDAALWIAALDAHTGEDESGDGRLGLHGRVESQLVAGEPVTVLETDDSGRWVRVLAPWQPTPESPAGYPGWVPADHLTAGPAAYGQPVAQRPATGAGEHPALPLAREHLGLGYLWGGLTPLGLDCSGLVHHTWRHLGVVVPRDAYAQAQSAQPIPVDAVRPGDLYFFGRTGQRIHHVGIVVSPGRMVHASETGDVLVEEDLPPERLDTLVAAGRLPLP